MKTHSIVKRYTKDFLNTEVKEYAIYVIKTRSLPSVMDGMRIGARKILYAAITGDLKKNNKIKMPSLIGDTMKLEFHHGDISLKNTIEQLGSESEVFDNSIILPFINIFASVQCLAL